MDELIFLFFIGLGFSLAIGSSILIIKRNDRFSFLTGIFTLKPVLAAIWIFGIALLWQKLDIYLAFGYTLIIFFLPDFLIGIVAVIALRDVVSESWLAVSIYLIDTVRWLGWLSFLAANIDFFGIIELIEISLHGFTAIVNVSILFIKSKHADKFEIEPSQS